MPHPKLSKEEFIARILVLSLAVGAMIFLTMVALWIAEFAHLIPDIISLTRF